MTNRSTKASTLSAAFASFWFGGFVMRRGVQAMPCVFFLRRIAALGALLENDLNDMGNAILACRIIVSRHGLCSSVGR